jgi:hypothetical protein
MVYKSGESLDQLMMAECAWSKEKLILWKVEEELSI